MLLSVHVDWYHRLMTASFSGEVATCNWFPALLLSPLSLIDDPRLLLLGTRSRHRTQVALSPLGAQWTVYLYPRASIVPPFYDY